MPQSTRSVGPHSMPSVPVAGRIMRRVGFGCLAAIGFTGLGVFAFTHPLGWFSGLLIACCLLGMLAVRSDAWLVVVPGLAPVIDLAGWTGAIHLTESDALVLGALALGGLREATAIPASVSGYMWRLGPAGQFAFGAMGVSYLLSTSWQGLWTVGLDPSLLAGYSTSLNGPRLAKGCLWVLLLLPLLAAAFRTRPQGARCALISGVLLGLLLISLGALWERIAFTGLTDFASDYRTTALFWEMNVGGATLDGWLALSVPFALWMVLREHRPRHLFALMVLMALAAYVVFTTFSRGLYFGLALGGLITMVMMLRAEVARDTARPAPIAVIGWSGFALLLGWLLTGVFQTGGYRGLLAVVGLAASVFAIAPLVAVSSLRQFGWAVVLGCLGGGLSVGAMWWLPKGVYLAYALSGACLLGLLVVRPPVRWLIPLQVCAIACVVWLAIGATLVPVYWAEDGNWLPGTLATLWLLVPLGVVHRRPQHCWRSDPRSWVRWMLVIGAIVAVVVTFNTYYATKRFQTVAEDFGSRMQHWRVAAGLVEGGRALGLGLGVGQFAERYFWQVPDGMYPGSHRIEREETGNLYLRLGGARHALGFGELYRVSQRVRPDLEAPFVLSLRLRAPEGDATLHTEICRKHLLYTTECTGRELAVRGGLDWQRVEVAVEKNGLGDGGEWLPRLTVFSVANGSQGRLVEVDDLGLIDRHGRELIRNGDFSVASDFWFFSSDRYHLPWHAKNLWLHYFVEQGLLGLLAFSALSLIAIYRVTLGGAARHALAPPLAGGLAAFMAVGAFDSLVDAPRLAMFVFLLMALAIGLRTSPEVHRASRFRRSPMQ